MAIDPDATSPGQHGEPVYNRGPRIIVTSRYIENAQGRFPMGELHRMEAVHVFARPARRVAVFAGLMELALGILLAAVYGSGILLCTGFLAAGGLAVAILIDARRNPHWMALTAIYRGEKVALFTSRNKREFGQVKRAVARAVEKNRPPSL